MSEQVPWQSKMEQPTKKMNTKNAATRGKKISRHSQKDQASFGNGAIEGITDVISLFLHGLDYVVAHTVGSLPENPIPGLLFVGVLIVLVLRFGSEATDIHRQNLCYACIAALSLIGVCLTIVIVRTPAPDRRLQEGQDERLRAIAVKAFPYEDTRN